mgnify:FL=1
MYIDLKGHDDVCCELGGTDCICHLEQAHLNYIYKNGFEQFNVLWCIDEINGYCTSKVGIIGDPAVHLLTTTITSKDTYSHEME